MTQIRRAYATVALWWLAFACAYGVLVATRPDCETCGNAGVVLAWVGVFVVLPAFLIGLALSSLVILVAQPWVRSGFWSGTISAWVVFVAVVVVLSLLLL